MKVMIYNVYRGGEDRLSLIKNIISHAAPDILGIQEACFWGSKEMTDLANVVSTFQKGLIFEANQRSSNGFIYNQAFFSKFKIKDYKIFNDFNSVWHVLAHITVMIDQNRNLHFLLAHLSPLSEDWRLLEIKKINEILSFLKDEPVVLMGDLNSLSPEDYYPASLLEKLYINKITKFGCPAKFEVISKLLEAGWYDPLPSRYNSDILPITVKEGSADKDHLNLRLDYIMVNSIAKPLVKKIKIINNNLVHKASDHFPVLLEIDI